MTSSNVETYRASHQAFNRRDFDVMIGHYAERIRWTDHARGRTFRTRQEFIDDFLQGWVTAASDIQIIDPTYLDVGQTVVCTFTVIGTHDGPLGPFPATGRRFRLPLCELWRFDPSGQVVGGDLYYDQVSLLGQLGVLPLPAAA